MSGLKHRQNFIDGFFLFLAQGLKWKYFEFMVYCVAINLFFMSNLLVNLIFTGSLGMVMSGGMVIGIVIGIYIERHGWIRKKLKSYYRYLRRSV